MFRQDNLPPLNNRKKSTNNFLVGKTAINKFKNTLNIMSQAVIQTLGPNGSTSIINNGYEIRITKDGVTVANALNSNDKFEDTYLNMIKEAAKSVNEKSGDGTTTCVLLMKEIVLNGFNKIELGYSHNQITKYFDMLLVKILKIIKEKSITPNANDLKNVATLSANNDSVLGELVYDAITKLGNINKHYLISVEDSKSTKTYLDFTQGIKIDSGYISPYFVTGSNRKIELVNVEVCLYNGKVNNGDFVHKFLEHLTLKNCPGILVCEDIEKNYLGNMLVNNMQKIVSVVVVKCPVSGKDGIEILKDIATLTGAKIYDVNVVLDDTEICFNSSYLGQCKNVNVDQNSTSFIGSDVEKSIIDQRAEAIREMIEEAGTDSNNTNKIQVEKLNERYAMLKGGVAIIKVGGDTEIEIREKKDRVLDAVLAAKSGKEGILCGGGITLFNIGQILEAEEEKIDDKEYYHIAKKIIAHALKQPLHQILINAGLNNEQIYSIIHQIKTNKDNMSGYNALTHEFTNMRESGIVDSTESVIQILKSAFSVSKVALSLSSVIVQKESEMN